MSRAPGIGGKKYRQESWQKGFLGAGTSTKPLHRDFSPYGKCSGDDLGNLIFCRRLFFRNPTFAPERLFYLKFRRPEHAQGLLHRKTSLQTNVQVTKSGKSGKSASLYVGFCRFRRFVLVLGLGTSRFGEISIEYVGYTDFQLTDSVPDLISDFLREY